MKKVDRQPLRPGSLRRLSSQQSKIDAVPDGEARKRKAGSLWDSKTGSKVGKRTFEDVRDVLRAMCNAPERCMYCEDNEATDIEHIRPKSEYPKAAFVWENFLLACPTCNSRFKGSQYHRDFMDPSSPGYDLWKRWVFDPRTGHYFPGSDSDEGASETLRILGFDHRREGLAERRRRYLTLLVTGIRDYAKAKAAGRTARAQELARSLSAYFPALVEWVLTRDPEPSLFPDIVDIRKVKARYPEILEDVFVHRRAS